MECLCESYCWCYCYVGLHFCCWHLSVLITRMQTRTIRSQLVQRRYVCPILADIAKQITSGMVCRTWPLLRWHGFCSGQRGWNQVGVSKSDGIMMVVGQDWPPGNSDTFVDIPVGDLALPETVRLFISCIYCPDPRVCWVAVSKSEEAPRKPCPVCDESRVELVIRCKAIVVKSDGVFICPWELCRRPLLNLVVKSGWLRSSGVWRPGDAQWSVINEVRSWFLRIRTASLK